MENNEYISQISEGMIINSQNDRIAGAGRDLKRSESNSPAKAGALLWIAQVDIQPDLEYLHKRRLQNFSG